MFAAASSRPEACGLLCRGAAACRWVGPAVRPPRPSSVHTVLSSAGLLTPAHSACGSSGRRPPSHAPPPPPAFYPSRRHRLSQDPPFSARAWPFVTFASRGFSGPIRSATCRSSGRPPGVSAELSSGAGLQANPPPSLQPPSLSVPFARARGPWDDEGVGGRGPGL